MQKPKAQSPEDTTEPDMVVSLEESGDVEQENVEYSGVAADLPPKAPSFITRVCGFGFHIRRLRFGQARRARSPQIAQALDALQRVFGFPMMSGV